MPEPESGALPLGDTPITQKQRRNLNGWTGWIRTSGMTESKSVALPLGYGPTKIALKESGVDGGIRTHDLQSHNLAR